MSFRDDFDRPPLAPLPGTSAPRRALFVDRWGTLLEPPPADPRRAYSRLSFVPGTLDALFRATQAGWRVYLLGNEEAVARGHVQPARWERFESEMLSELAKAGVRVERCYACLDHPEHGKGAHLRDSVFLLPNTGAMYHARQHDGIDLKSSWVIGDSTLELAAGWRAGCRTAGVRSGLGLADQELETDVELVADDLAAVLDEILELARAAHR